jgi:hypothetical protein
LNIGDYGIIYLRNYRAKRHKPEKPAGSERFVRTAGMRRITQQFFDQSEPGKLPGRRTCGFVEDLLSLKNPPVRRILRGSFPAGPLKRAAMHKCSGKKQYT